jgi:molybdate transport system ATP-binding protein
MADPHFRAAPLVALRGVSLRIRDRHILEGTTWELRLGEHWVVVGPNGAGKSTLVRALAGEIPVVGGEVCPAEPALLRRQAAVVSFERHRGMVAREERGDAQRYFSGNVDGGTRVGDLFQYPRRRPPIVGAGLLPSLDLGHLIEHRIRDLSAGEMRRFQIALALAAEPPLLILDEPFEALDAASRNELADLINQLMNADRSVVLVTHRRREIPPNATHVIGVQAGRVVFQGRREDVLDPERMDSLYASRSSALREPPAPVPPQAQSGNTPSEVLVDLRNVTVRHQGVAVFENLSWAIRSGQHWAVCGPNGSGKTTLMSLIVGDHPQAYANTVRVFGKLRGSGSIREIKEGIGLISAELQVRYRKAVTAAEVVLSGFFDSVGLYRRASPGQQAAAQNWMTSFAIQGLAGKRFNHLSHGEQRMVLLARSMVKPPRLLVLDEPCQGLDTGNRRLILQAVDRIAAAGLTTILYVSHHPDEIPACITCRLCLVRSGSGPSRAVLSAAA